ncbi:hypothetical protein EBR25_08220 [bacterium]|nr:hypothetical protein [bacterium]
MKGLYYLNYSIKHRFGRHWLAAPLFFLFIVVLFGGLPAKSEENSLTYVPVGSQDNKSLHLIVPNKFRSSAVVMSGKIDEEFKFLTDILEIDENFKTQIRLMEASTFYERMQVPTWTNAIYLKSRIIIPIASASAVSSQELQRAIRHELVHAIIDHQTSGTCPGWLDEGLAQLLEGPEHPVLKRALRKWIIEEGVIPFELLQNGFTKLPRAMVPAAYAQSLYATKFLLSHESPEVLRAFFDDLRDNVPFSLAFEERFDVSFEHFELLLSRQLEQLALERSEEGANAIWRLTYQDLKGGNVSIQPKKASISAQAVSWKNN